MKGINKGVKNGNYGKHTWNYGLKGVMPIPWNKGSRMSEKSKEKLRASLKGRTVWNTGIKTGHIPWNKGNKFLQVTGENNTNWKGGITPINEKIRKSVEYKLWREAIFKRDK